MCPFLILFCYIVRSHTGSVEEVYNTSTVTLEVVEGNGKGVRGLGL
jgi:hypothetical protein